MSPEHQNDLNLKVFLVITAIAVVSVSVSVSVCYCLYQLGRRLKDCIVGPERQLTTYDDTAAMRHMGWLRHTLTRQSDTDTYGALEKTAPDCSV